MKTLPATPAPSAAADEAALIARIAAGDRRAFETLMRRHNRPLYRLARTVLGDPTEAEDVLQETYLLVWRSIGSFRGEAALSTWLSRLVINECANRTRRRARRQNVVPIVSPNTHAEVEAVPDTHAELPDEALARARVRALLERKLDALPEPFRIVFFLRSVEELSVENTAALLGVPDATVRSRHFRAKGLLRESLAREFDRAERDVFEFGGEHCDRVVANVLARLDSVRRQDEG
jgi:RNA polymerase sigma-70 factor (ECF subfamily)